jgi:GT2 family glycosyltransferase/nucleoside-diphosphate-sugar epimerase
VVVNYRAGSVLIDCLFAISGQAREVVVVDNGSGREDSDGILEQVGRFGGKVRLLRSPVNMGFARACNLGIKECSGEAVLLLNPDCIAPPGLVEQLWDVLCKNPRAGMVGPLLQNPDGSEQRGARRLVPSPGRALIAGFGMDFLTGSRFSMPWGIDLGHQPLPKDPTPVEAISGACMMLRRAALADAGAMDEEYFLHCEDLDLCVRFRERGWDVFFDPKSQVVHLKGACSWQRPLAVEWHKHWGMVRFYRKHFKKKYPAFLGPLIFLGVWLRFAGVAVLSAVRRKKSPLVGQHPPVPAGPSGPPCAKPRTGVLGASSFVGRALLPLLLREGRCIEAFSRVARISQRPGLSWHLIEDLRIDSASMIADWISMCPLPALAEILPRLAARGARRLVAVSSTSRFTKIDSPDPRERRLAEQLAAAEEKIFQWAADAKVEVVVLRPTLVYDGVDDANIAAISRFIRRWGWFPVCGPVGGLRQPLHACDLAHACAAALASAVPIGAFNLSGGETLSYRAMVERVFGWENRRPRIVPIPAWLLSGILPVLRCLPWFRGLSMQVFKRMNNDLVFDHSEAAKALEFNPRGFEPPTDWEIPC